MCRGDHDRGQLGDVGDQRVLVEAEVGRQGGGGVVAVDPVEGVDERVGQRVRGVAGGRRDRHVLQQVRSAVDVLARGDLAQVRHRLVGVQVVELDDGRTGGRVLEGLDQHLVEPLGSERTTGAQHALQLLVGRAGDDPRRTHAEREQGAHAGDLLRDGAVGLEHLADQPADEARGQGRGERAGRGVVEQPGDQVGARQRRRRDALDVLAGHQLAQRVRRLRALVQHVGHHRDQRARAGARRDRGQRLVHQLLRPVGVDELGEGGARLDVEQRPHVPLDGGGQLVAGEPGDQPRDVGVEEALGAGSGRHGARVVATP
ncbi:hypothetical protein L615_000600000110 [Nocardioides sp. J9]|nr:hypothetical protein L615_000600000110 [Nocardioides sp. J9]